VDPAREHDLVPLTTYLRGRGARVSAVEFANAMGQLKTLSRDAIRATAQFDAVLLPTLAQLPRPLGWFVGSDGDPAQDFERQKQFTPFTAIFNTTGQPAISVPLCQSEAGLPVGIMLAGRPAGEPLLFALAAQLEAALPWIARRPPIW
jgi:amidase